MAAKEVTGAQFGEVVGKATLPVLVDFWASWCGPCRIMSPVVDDIADELAGQVEVYKCNVEENQDVAMKYQVMSIPTLGLFKDGNLVHTMVGAQSKDAVLAELKSYL